MSSNSNYSSGDFASAQQKLKEIQHSFTVHGDLSMTLPRIHAFLNEHQFPALRGELEAIEDDYRLMTDFMLRGFKDDKRETLYGQLLCRLYHLLGDLEIDFQINCNVLFSPFRSLVRSTSLDGEMIREQLIAFVQDVAMLSLEPEDVQQAQRKIIYETHFNYINRLFVALMLSHQWSKSFGEAMAHLLASPEIDSNDAQTLTSAVMLSAMNVGDPEKFLALAYIYRHAQDTAVRQRALVGWVLVIAHDSMTLFREVTAEVNSLLSDEDVRHEVLQMQMQIIYCQNATQDQERLRKDIIPTIMKNQDFEVTRYGIKEKIEDPMNDILHPDADDQKMEEMENAIKKMADMQKAGADLYFDGFSQMKRFSFFYTLSNWFTPFYPEHPQMQHIPERFIHSPFIEQLMKGGPFCDSDKYSFVLGFSTVYNKLPDKIKQLLSTDQLQMTAPELQDNMQTPTYIRRMYLQDLYRFFKLNDYRVALQNPFDESGKKLFFTQTAFVDKMKDEAHNLMRFLVKRNMFESLDKVLSVYGDDDNVDDLKMKASVCMRRGDTEQAAQAYSRALVLNPHDEQSMKGLAIACFDQKNFNRAAELYQSLLTLHPDSRQFALYLAIARINNNEVDEGVRLLYKLTYEHPDDLNIQRALAWGEMWLGHTEQAHKLYATILDSNDKSPADFLNSGYCFWFEGNIKEAVERMRQFISLSNRKEGGKQRVSIRIQLEEDKALLDKYQISVVDRKLVADLASRTMQEQ